MSSCRLSHHITAHLCLNGLLTTLVDSNGIWPSPGLCVFNQMDFDKSRSVSLDELRRTLNALKSVFSASDDEVSRDRHRSEKGDVHGSVAYCSISSSWICTEDCQNN